MRFEMGRGPTASEGPPFLLLDVLQPEFLQSGDSPVRRPIESRRSGYARPTHVGEVEHIVHHLGVVEGFGLDSMDDRQIYFLFGHKEQRSADRHSAPN